jgi:hypothetical protein
VAVTGSQWGEFKPGSYPPGTWPNNAQAVLVTPDNKDFAGDDMGGAKLHTGFHAGFRAMIGPIRAAVRRALPSNGNRILVVGHSQGGAVAQIIAASLAAIAPEVTGRFYANPRVGNKEWAAYVDKILGDRSHHIHQYDDSVGRMPPTALGYHHSSHEILTTKAGKWLHCQGSENPLCLAGESFKDMSMERHSGPFGQVFMGCGGDK